MRGIPLILSAVLLGAAGQVIMKKGMQIYGEVSAGNVWQQLIPILRVPQVTLGLMCYALSAVLWIAVVSKFDLSLAYPMVSVAYVAVFVASWLLFGEKISAARLAGTHSSTMAKQPTCSSPRASFLSRARSSSDRPWTL